MITIQNYVRAQSLEEAYELNQKKRNRIVGGMLWLKTSTASVGTAIDLTDLGLNKIEENEEEFSIGAMTTLRQIELHEGLNAYTQNAVRKAVQDIIGVQFRNLATVGGSLWGRFGFSDVLTVFMAMDSYVELYKGGVIALSDFAKMKADRDILVRLIIKKKPLQVAYQAMRIQKTDFPVLTCCAAMVDGKMKMTVGARPNKAVLVTDEKGILSDGLTLDAVEKMAQEAAQTVPTGGNIRGSAAYRTHLVKVLSSRALCEIGGLCNGN